MSNATAPHDSILECFNNLHIVSSVHGAYKASIVHSHGIYRFIIQDNATDENLARVLVTTLKILVISP